MPSYTKLASTPPPTIGFPFMSRTPLGEAKNNVVSFLKPQEFQFPLEKTDFLKLEKDFKLLISSDPAARGMWKNQLLEKLTFAKNSTTLFSQVKKLLKDNFSESQSAQKTNAPSLQK